MHRISCLLLIALWIAGCGNSKTDIPSPSAADSTVASPGLETPDVKEPKDDRPIILAFGDSLTAGSGLLPGHGYPEMLQAELDQQGYSYHVVNAGIGGDTTAGGLARISAGVALKPEVVVLELGGNDGLRGTPIESMKANLDELIVTFKKAGAKVILAGMTLPRNFGPEYIGASEMVYPALATKHQITLIPFFLEGAAGIPELNLEDGIHPNEEGYRFVTANVLKYLVPLLKK